MRLKTTLLFLLLITSLAVAKQEKTSVAVVDFIARGVPDYEAQIIAERVRAELVNSGLYNVMERGQMKTILQEQGFQQSGACSDASCVVEIGELLAVEKMITGSVGKLGGMYTLNVKMVNITTGQIELTISEDIVGKIEDIIVKKTIPKIVKKLIDGTMIINLNIGYLNITTKPNGANVIIDDKLRGTTPLEKIEVDAGVVLVKFSLENYISCEKSITVEKGKTKTLEMKLSPTAKYLSSKEKASSAKKSEFRKLLRLTSFGVAAIGLGAGGYFHYDWDKKYTQYKDSSDPKEKGDLHPQIRALEQNRLISLIVGGIGALGVGVTYVF